MTDFLRLLLDVLYAVCPVRIVWQWQEGVYYVCGKSYGRVGPGLKLIIPGLCDVRTMNVSPEIYTTQLQTITLRDGTILTYSASITVIVTDAAKAFNKLGHYDETVVELAARVLSDGLADANPVRFDPARGKRDNLLAEMQTEINKQCEQYGLLVTGLGLNNFVRGARTIRLLTDRAVLGNV